jgi:plasmid stabilization system protein ParE
MALDVVLHPEASDEFDEAIAYLEREEAGLGQRFFDAIDARFQRIAEHPRSGKRVGRTVRRYVVPDWRYSIIYALEPERVFIVAIAHQSRRPAYWRSRLR